MKVTYKDKSIKTYRRFKLNIVFLTLAALLFFILTAFTACTQSNGVFSFTEKDNGSSISLDKGQRIEIKLDSNITTGYSWKLPENADAKIVSLVSSEYIESEKDKEMVGTGGIETFIFEAKEAGQAEIILEYVRPWEKNTEPEKIFKLKITVKQ